MFLEQIPSRFPLAAEVNASLLTHLKSRDNLTVYEQQFWIVRGWDRSTRQFSYMLKTRANRSETYSEIYFKILYAQIWLIQRVYTQILRPVTIFLIRLDIGILEQIMPEKLICSCD